MPGSFNPLTTAHLAIADAVVVQHGVARVDLVLSRVALAKEHVVHPLVEHRHEVLRRVAAARPHVGAVLTDAQLVADIASGYDLLVVGADKWAQLLDVRFYGGSAAARDEALARLPPVVVVPRPPDPTPPGVAVLDVPGWVSAASSTLVRAGQLELMAPEAKAFDEETGAWTDPDRYSRWLAAAG
jgi:hypothetical protein